MEFVFHGVAIEYINSSDLEKDCFEYVGLDSDIDGYLWHIVRDIREGRCYCTILNGKDENKDLG